MKPLYILVVCWLQKFPCVCVESWTLTDTSFSMSNPPSLLAGKVWRAVRWHVRMCFRRLLSVKWPLLSTICYDSKTCSSSSFSPSQLGFCEKLRHHPSILFTHKRSKWGCTSSLWLPPLSERSTCCVYCRSLRLFCKGSCWINVILVNSECISIICANRNNVGCHSAASCILQSHIKLLPSSESKVC